MQAFLIQRVFSAFIVVLGVSCLVFMLIHLIPGDPVDVMLGESARTADRVALRSSMGLDQPMLVQLQEYYFRLFQLDLGTSIHKQRPVTELLAERIPATAVLAVAALLVSIGLAIPMGILAAVRRDTVWDYGAMSFSLLGASIPNFWLGPMLILLFSLTLGWLPVSGRSDTLSLVLPALTLGTGLAAVLARMIRSSLLEVLREDYVRTAKAKGLRPMQIILRHALRNALLPVITLFGLQLGALLAGAVITETIFSWPGVGLLMIEAIQSRDYPVVQGCVLLISGVYVLVNISTDLLYGFIDPRIRIA